MLYASYTLALILLQKKITCFSHASRTVVLAFLKTAQFQQATLKKKKKNIKKTQNCKKWSIDTIDSRYTQ